MSIFVYEHRHVLDRSVCTNILLSEGSLERIYRYVYILKQI